MDVFSVGLGFFLSLSPSYSPLFDLVVHGLSWPTLLRWDCVMIQILYNAIWWCAVKLCAFSFMEPIVWACRFGYFLQWSNCLARVAVGGISLNSIESTCLVQYLIQLKQCLDGVLLSSFFLIQIWCLVDPFIPHGRIFCRNGIFPLPLSFLFATLQLVSIIARFVVCSILIAWLTLDVS